MLSEDEAAKRKREEREEKLRYADYDSTSDSITNCYPLNDRLTEWPMRWLTA